MKERVYCEECNAPIRDFELKSNVWEVDEKGIQHQLMFCSEKCLKNYKDDCAKELFTCSECKKSIIRFKVNFGYDRSEWGVGRIIHKKKLLNIPNYIVLSNENVKDPYTDKDIPKNAELVCQQCFDGLELEECESCGRMVRSERSIHHDAYSDPWDDEEEHFIFCSEPCEDARMYENDFAYFTCNKCSREICEQNPSNGWMTQYRTLGGEMVCLKCYEKELYENGIPSEDLKKGDLSGMFLDDGDPKKHGFKQYDELNGYIKSKGQANEVCNKLLELQADGYIVLVEYSSMAIGGLEGYCNYWIKLDEREKDDIFDNLNERIGDNVRLKDVDFDLVETYPEYRDTLISKIENTFPNKDDADSSILKLLTRLKGSRVSEEIINTPIES